MAVSEKDDESDVDGDGPPLPWGVDPRTVLGNETTACLQTLAKDFKNAHTVLIQVRNLASGTRRSQDLALAKLHGDVAQACATLEWLWVGLEVGRVSHSAQELKSDKKKL